MNKEKVIALFMEKGLTILEEINSTTYNVIVDGCKHTSIVYVHNLNPKNTYKCNQCINEEFLKRCKLNNLEILENPAVNTGFSEYKKYVKFLRKECGHTFIAMRTRISDMPRCATCLANSVNEKLTENKLELVEKISSLKSVYKFKCCGHSRTLFNIAAQRGNALCHECKSTSQSKPSKLYLIKFKTNSGFEFVKFGYGKNTKNRLREYKLENIVDHRILFELEVSTGTLARSIEKQIHKKFIKNKLSNEEMKIFLTKTGYSECYGIDLTDQLLSEIQLIIKDITNG